MKKLMAVTIITTIAILNFSSIVGADSTPPVREVSLSGMTSNIDDIEVPLEVLLELQTEFQGQAVNQARKLKINGKEVYRLRVDRDSETNDYDKDTKYVYYDMSWKRLEEKDVTVKVPLKVEQPTTVQVETVKPAAPEPTTRSENKEKPSTTETPQEPAPDKPAEEEPTSTTEGDTTTQNSTNP